MGDLSIISVHDCALDLCIFLYVTVRSGLVALDVIWPGESGVVGDDFWLTCTYIIFVSARIRGI
jgi:hypothetical protein